MCLLLPLISGRGSWAACLISMSVSLLTTWREWRPHPSQDGGVLFARAHAWFARPRVLRLRGSVSADVQSQAACPERGPRRADLAAGDAVALPAGTPVRGPGPRAGRTLSAVGVPGRPREVEGQEGRSAEQAAADPRGKPSDPCGRGVSLGTALAWPAGRWDFSPFSLALLAGATAPGPRTVLTRHRPCPSLVICCSIDCFSDSCCLVLRRPKPR